MYEHLRNEFISEIETQFDDKTIERILKSLDKVAYNFEIAERVTALAVVDDETSKLVKLYLASKRLEGLSSNSIKMYGKILRYFFDEVRKPPQELTINEIRYFLATYKGQSEISNRTLDKYRQVINAFFEWCANEEYITKNPCKNIKEIKWESKPRQALTRFQLERLRRACKTPRELAIIDVLYSTGCRVAELVNMKVTDIDYEQNTVQIIGKGGKHNTCYLNTNAQISLAEYMKTRKGNSEYIFTSPKKPYGRLSIRGVEWLFTELGKEVNYKVSPHVIRHTTATLALQSNMPITQVQKMLGHASVKTTQIYAETSQEDVAYSHKRCVI